MTVQNVDLVAYWCNIGARAMAVVGISIGASFALALVLGPMVAAWGGLSAVFYVTAALAAIGILIVLFAVPRARRVAGYLSSMVPRALPCAVRCAGGAPVGR